MTRFAARLCIPVLVCIVQFAAAQTPNPAPAKSYLQPGDSIWVELSCSSGDVLSWSLWLAASPRDGNVTLSFRSDAAGELWRKEFGSEAVDVKQEEKVPASARYRFVLTAGATGRPATLSAWAKLADTGRIPFPMPDVKRVAENFTAGDQYAVEFEFTVPDTMRFETLLALDLPRDLVRMWAMTPSGDSLSAAASVRRWIGDGGLMSLRERRPKGGKIALRLELDIPEQGEHTIFLAPQASVPEWLPKSARMVTTRKHDPWRAVVVPPWKKLAEHWAITLPEPSRLPFVAQQFRVSGVDAQIAAKLLPVIAERDSQLATRYERRKAAGGYDTSFVRGVKSFLPPDLHLVFFSSFRPTAAEKQRPNTVITWFAENPRGNLVPSDVIEWRYAEARFAYPSVPDQMFWDAKAIPLNPRFTRMPAPTAGKPNRVSLPAVAGTRPMSVTIDGETLLDQSREVWGLYLDNQTPDTLYLVYHRENRIEHSMATKLSRWPKSARYTAVVLVILVIVGGIAVSIMRKRELQRRRAAKELEEELEKARSAQLKLLPSAPLEIENLHIIGLHQSMQSVGGDYYDFFALEDGSVLVCVADVTGHGYKAALIMSNLQATLRAVAQPGRTVCEIASLLNLEVHKRTNPEDFVTFILGKISADRKHVTVCNAGHNPGYIVQPSGRIIELTEGGIMLGALDMFPFCEKDYPLDVGDLLVFYTDGIPEATINKQGEMYGYDRLKLFLAEHRYDSLSDITHRMLKQVIVDERQPIEDDMAIVLARVDQ